MTSKKKTAKKGDKGTKNKTSEQIEELRSIINGLREELDKMNQTIKKQGKRISALETDNKRMKKNLTKMQMGDSNSFLSPKASETFVSDVDAPSDMDDSKSFTDTVISPKSTKSNAGAAKKKEKVVARRHKPKPKINAEDIKFTFDLKHDNIIATENGSIASKKKVVSGTIRFGRFLNYKTNNPTNLASYTITFDTRGIGTSSSVAFGFANTSFSEWNASNFGQNNSVIVKGNGAFLTTDKVYYCVNGKEYKHKQTLKSLQTSPKDGFFKDGDEVSVMVDLKNCIGKIWNETTNKDGEENGRVFEIGLPEKYEICIVVYMVGSQKKKIFVKDQKFIFDEEDDAQEE